MTSFSRMSPQELLESLGGAVEDFHKSEEVSTPSTTYSTGRTSGVEERALVLLGSGIAPESVAAALGVTPSRISQLLADEDFNNAVTELRFQALQSHNERDGKYDKLEDKLISMLEDRIGLLIKPLEIVKVMQIVNAAKRRGQSAPEQVTNQQNIVNIVLPEKVALQFTTNVNNQVIKAGEKELQTISSGQLLKRIEDSQVLPPPAVSPPEENLQCAESTNIEQEEPL